MDMELVKIEREEFPNVLIAGTHTVERKYYKDKGLYRTKKDLTPGDGCCGFDSKPIPAGTVVELFSEPADNWLSCFVIRSLDGTMVAYDPYGFYFLGERLDGKDSFLEQIN